MADLITARPAVAGQRSRLVLRAAALLYLGVLVLVPIAVVSWRTFGDGWAVFWSAISSADAVTAFRLTLEVAVASVLLNGVLGVGLALLIARYRFPGRRIFGALADLPISVSPIVVGLALVLVYGPIGGWFGSGLRAAGISIIYAVPGMVLATTFVSLPLIFRELVPLLQEEGTDQEQAAGVLGATGWQQFWRITFPTIRPALLYGVVLTFARSIGEYGAVKVVSGNVGGVGQTQTVPLLVGDRAQQLAPGAYQLAFVLMVITVAAITAVSAIQHKGPEK